MFLVVVVVNVPTFDARIVSPTDSATPILFHEHPIKVSLDYAVTSKHSLPFSLGISRPVIDATVIADAHLTSPWR